MAPPKFVHKTFSKRLDANLSVAYIETVREVSSLACVLFMRDRDEQLDSFTLQLTHYDMTEAIEDGNLITRIEDAYLEMQQLKKNAAVGDP